MTSRPPGSARERRSVRPAGRGQRARRRDGRPGAHRSCRCSPTDEFGLTSAIGDTRPSSSRSASGRRSPTSLLGPGRPVGRKPVLVAGWLIGMPVPLLIIAAPDWSWVVAANVLLGINQGLTWSTTVIMKVDLVGPRAARPGARAQRGRRLRRRRAASAADHGLHRRAQAGLRPAPFLFGLADRRPRPGLSVLLVRETRGHAAARGGDVGPATGDEVPRVAWRGPAPDVDRRPRLFAASQAGLVNNLNDGLAWGLLPLFFAARGLPMARSPSWPRSTRRSGASPSRHRCPVRPRRPASRSIVAGMLVQAVAIAVIAIERRRSGRGPSARSRSGSGTALVYPTLMPRSPTSPPRPGGHRPSGSIGCGGTSGSRPGPCVAGLIADAAGVPDGDRRGRRLTAARPVVAAVVLAGSRRGTVEAGCGARHARVRLDPPGRSGARPARRAGQRCRPSPRPQADAAASRRTGSPGGGRPPVSTDEPAMIADAQASVIDDTCPRGAWHRQRLRAAVGRNSAGPGRASGRHPRRRHAMAAPSRHAEEAAAANPSTRDRRGPGLAGQSPARIWKRASARAVSREARPTDDDQ